MPEVVARKPMSEDHEAAVLDLMRSGSLSLAAAARELGLGRTDAYCVEHLAFAEAVGTIYRERQGNRRRRYAVRGDELGLPPHAITV